MERLRIRRLAQWNLLVWDEAKFAEMKHPAGEITDEGLGLHVQVSKHFVWAPSANEPNDVGIDMGAEQRYCTCSPEGQSTNVSCKKADFAAIEKSDGASKRIRDMGRADFVEALLDFGGRQGSAQWQAMAANVKDSPGDRPDGAVVLVAA
jgi:hypothetical protein